MSVQAVAKRFHLAQFNIGKMRHPGSAAEMAGYDEALTRVLPVAVAWPGFVWIMDDDIIAMIEGRFSQGFAANLSVWSDIESLQGFMDCPPHAAAMGRRNEWFAPVAEATFMLWWIAAGRHPDFAEGC